jgi:Neurotransmitter-gated ion-channel ligand binding domain
MRPVLLVFLLLMAAGVAQSAEPLARREVSVGLYLVDITKIDETSNTFTTELDVYVSWRDPELVFDPEIEGISLKVYSGQEAKDIRASIWTAQIYPTNPVGRFSDGGEKILIHPDGKVELTARINGTMRARLDYRRFPFDTQILPIELESFPWNRDEVRLVPDQERTGFDQLYALAEWEVLSVDLEQYETTRVRDVVPFSNLLFNISVERDAGFYLWKIFLTVIIIVSLTWVVFWMSSEGLGRRAGVSSGGILTVIAYQFVTTSSLPRVSYLTVADKVMILSVVIIAATMVESLVVDGLTATNMPRKVKIDRICRVAFPASYFVLLIALALRNNVFG